MEPTDKLPGVTFYVERSSLRDRHGSVVLNASVEDPELWNEVLAKLDNFRIYTVGDLSTAIIEVLQEENKAGKEVHARETAELRARLERAEQQLSLYQAREREEDKLSAELAKLYMSGRFKGLLE
jgi:hypothetical protein